MASSKTPVIGFLGGEVDGITLARVDLAIAPQTAETLENVYLITQGGMELAPGTKFIGETPSSARVWLRSWVYNQEQGFCLEQSEELIRFIFQDGYVTLAGAAATVATFTDESAVPSGGGAPPDGGSGAPLQALASPTSLTGAQITEEDAYCYVTGGSGTRTYLWTAMGATPIAITTPTLDHTNFTSVTVPASGSFICTVTDTGTGEVVASNFVIVLLSG